MSSSDIGSSDCSLSWMRVYSTSWVRGAPVHRRHIQSLNPFSHALEIEHYFEMSRPDSEHALRIYKTFTVQTEEVVKVLHVARRFEAATRLEIPDFEHASTDLTRLLEDDLNSPDFEVRRREYLAAKEAKRRGGPIYSTCSTPNKTALTSKPMLSLLQTQAETKSKAPPADLIDFFESTEPGQVQQRAWMQPAPSGIQGRQQLGFYRQEAQQTGFGQSAIMGSALPLQTYNPFGQRQLRNPFMQSMVASSPTGATALPSSLQGCNMNPFACHLQHSDTDSPAECSPAPTQQNQTSQPQPSQTPQVWRTGTNPFAQSTSVPPR